MYSYTRRGAGKSAALLAVLQSLLLLSALVLAPAGVIAQDGDSAAHNQQAVEATGEAPGKGDPGPKAKPAAEKTLSERGLTIRLYPQKPKVALYGTRIVSAWLCPANDKTPFGGAIASDGKPGTKDDDCRPVRVKWSVTDGAGARLSNSIGYKTRVTLTAKHPNRLVAEVGDLKRPSALVILDKPQKNRPNADQVREQVKQQKQAKQTKPAPKPVAPKVERPSDNVNVEQPVAEDPTEEPAVAEPHRRAHRRACGRGAAQPGACRGARRRGSDRGARGRGAHQGARAPAAQGCQGAGHPRHLDDPRSGHQELQVCRVDPRQRRRPDGQRQWLQLHPV